VAALVVGDILGAGIFFTPGEVAPRPIAAEADMAVGAQIAHGSDSHRGGSYTLTA